MAASGFVSWHLMCLLRSGNTTLQCLTLPLHIFLTIKTICFAAEFSFIVPAELRYLLGDRFLALAAVVNLARSYRAGCRFLFRRRYLFNTETLFIIYFDRFMKLGECFGNAHDCFTIAIRPHCDNRKALRSSLHRELETMCKCSGKALLQFCYIIGGRGRGGCPCITITL